MYNKTIWNPGDIITQEKWDNINNNLSILEAYQLPVTIEKVEEKKGQIKKVNNLKIEPSSPPSPFPALPVFNITIHKSYNEISKLLKQGIICWYFNNLDGTVNYINQFNDQDKTLNDGEFYFNGVEMINGEISSDAIDINPGTGAVEVPSENP